MNREHSAEIDDGSDSDERDKPNDPYNIVFISFFMFGIGAWLAWNSALAGLDYFASRFEPKRSPNFTFGFVYFWSSLVGSLLLLVVTKLTALVTRVTISILVI